MTDPPRATGTIHDLGYKRYVGTRRPSSTRWRVIMRHQIATSWKTWWRFKSAVGLAVITTMVAAAVIYFMHDKMFGMFSQGPIVRTFADSVLPASIEWYLRVAFIMSLTIGATVAADVQSGAFTFYFARSVRPLDYVAGKIAGLGALYAVVLLVGPLLLAALQLGMSGEPRAMLLQLPILGKSLAVGSLATLVYATVPLAFSALVPNRRYALALWAAYYVVVGGMALLLGYKVWGPLAALDLPTSLRIVTYELFDVQIRFGRSTNLTLVPALIGIGLHVGVAIAIVLYRVGSAQRTGIGGAS